MPYRTFPCEDRQPPAMDFWDWVLFVASVILVVVGELQ